MENFRDISVRQQGKEIKGSLLLGEEIKYKNPELNCHRTGIFACWGAV